MDVINNHINGPVVNHVRSSWLNISVNVTANEIEANQSTPIQRNPIESNQILKWPLIGPNVEPWMEVGENPIPQSRPFIYLHTIIKQSSCDKLVLLESHFPNNPKRFFRVLSWKWFQNGSKWPWWPQSINDFDFHQNLRDIYRKCSNQKNQKIPSMKRTESLLMNLLESSGISGAFHIALLVIEVFLLLESHNAIHKLKRIIRSEQTTAINR